MNVGAGAADTRPRFTHVGGPTVLIQAYGWRLLTDPTFDAPGRRYTFGWGSSSRKTSGPAVAASEVTPVDVVLLSHDHHADNLDEAGRALLPTAGTVVTTTSGRRRLGADNVRGLAPWTTTRVSAPGRPELEITATPCRHGPPLSRPVAGEVVGFAVLWHGQENGAQENGAQENGALWISGDTVLYDGVREVTRRIKVDTALLHLGGVKFTVTGPIRYSMNGREAVELVGLMRPRVAVPVHYEGWTHFREREADLRNVFAQAPAEVRDRIRWLPHGESSELVG